MSKEKHNELALVRLTERDLKILKKINAAGWLTTEQIGKYFFPGKSVNAVSKRLRKLASAGYVAIAKLSSTEYGLYRLAGYGKLALIEHTSFDEADISIPIQPPRKIQHFITINDLRFFFEQFIKDSAIELLFFFSERELSSYYRKPDKIADPMLLLLETYRIIPDALARIRVRRNGTDQYINVAIEYDAGTEQATFFGRTKVKQYAKLFAENYGRLDDFKVLTFARSIKRIVSLMRQTVQYQPPLHLFYFSLLEKLAAERWEACTVFLDPDDFFVSVRQSGRTEIIEKEQHAGIPKYALIGVPASCPRRVSLREDTEEVSSLSEFR